MEHLMNFFGRLHPVVVHLPIGMLFLACLFEALALRRRYRKLRVAVQPALFWGAAAALASLFTGFLLSREGGYDDHLLAQHRNSGIATVVLAIVIYYLRKSAWVIRKETVTGKPVRAMLFVPLIVLLTATGHLGGSLTHGEEFLSAVTSFDPPPPADPAEKIASVGNTDDALLYRDIIVPILEARCYSCHSAKKQKGELRLDDPDFILKGGEHGPVISPGDADSSALYTRMMLPLEDDDHMPPGEKPQPGSSEIDLVRLWINGGADFSRPVRNFQEAGKISRFITLLRETSEPLSWIPEAKIPPADEGILQSLRSSGAVVTPVSENSNYLMISFPGTKTLSMDDLAPLIAIKDHLVHLKVSYCRLADDHMRVVQKLDQLTRLHLDHTQVTDQGIAGLRGLKELRYINLVATDVTDKSVEFLADMHQLEQAYLFQTKITADGVAKLAEKIPGVGIDTGHYMIPGLPTDTIVYRRRL